MGNKKFTSTCCCRQGCAHRTGSRWWFRRTCYPCSWKERSWKGSWWRFQTFIFYVAVFRPFIHILARKCGFGNYSSVKRKHRSKSALPFVFICCLMELEIILFGKHFKIFSKWTALWLGFVLRQRLKCNLKFFVRCSLMFKSESW